MRRATWVVISGLLFAGLASELRGQTFQGGLRGEVRDPGGVLPGATVTLTNEATNISREAVTNEVGQYNFTAVVPGTYTIQVVLPGYKTYENRGVSIATQQFITLDVTLEIGAIEETITVTGESPLIETSTASHGTVLDRQALEVLPAPGRNAFLIGVTVPTVVATGDAQFNRQQDQTNASLVSLGGGARRANNYLLDGFPITDMRNRSVVNPTIEALEDIKVQVHTYDAEMGRTGGGVFNVTAKSGTNQYRGTGFYQTRPQGLVEQNFFLKREGIPRVDEYYRLYGSGFGGPIVRNRTFFWVAAEGYRSLTTRNGNLIFPTALERMGDFSQSFNADGSLRVIYDPLTTRTDPVTGQLVRDPFPGNQIPADRLNQVGANILGFMPRPDEDRSDGRANYRRTAEIVDVADMISGKVDHRFSDKVSLSGVYMYNRTDEPFTVYWDDNLFGSPTWKLDRRIHVLVLNNTYIPNDTTVVTLRGGWNRFEDNCSIPHDFDPGTLGFAPAFLNSIAAPKFPNLSIADYGEIGDANTMGWRPRNDIEWYSWGFNGTVSRLMGRHTVKIGADFQNLGLNTHIFGESSGFFSFTRGFTQGPDPLSPASGTGNALANLLLGFPASGNAPVSNPTEVFTRYYGAYIQDDFRVSSRLTVNYGLRLEHEAGLRERNDRMVVDFASDAASPLDALVNKTGSPLEGRTIQGGLVYAGINGARRHQGDPPAVKVSPRAGVVYALDPQTVIRSGYGIFWAPWNYPFPGTTNYGQTGYTQTTTLQQDSLIPFTTIDNPFPGGLEPPTGNSLGMLTGVGGNIDFIDPEKGAPRVQQWSADVQRELPGNAAITIGYMGAAGDSLGLGGTIDTVVNINQLDPNFHAMGPALLERVPNPFFGVEEAGGLAALETIERGQLLRPFPQFRNVNVRQMTAGKSRYHAMVLQLDKRVTRGWGGRFSYTFSRLMDNQFGETNHFAARPGVPLTAYDLDREWSRGLLDMPHKIVLAPIVELPFGVGRPYVNRRGVADAIVGGWTISAIVQLESGFPVAIGQTPNNSNLFGSGQRPNLTGADPKTSGGTIDRLGNYLNPTAWEQAPAFTFGNAPRTDPRVRTPFRKNLDIVFTKEVHTGGSTRAQVRIELLNATNTPKFRDFNTTLGSGTFGQITRQSGFMRIWQFSFRFLF